MNITTEHVNKHTHLDIVGVAGTVCVGVMAVGRAVFHMRGVDGDAPGLLLGRVVNVFVLFKASTPCLCQH